MIKRFASVAALGLLLAACAAGPPPEPPAPPPLDPTGTFDVSINAQGTQIGGVLVIGGSAAEGYTGNIDTEMGGAGITNIVVDGQVLTFRIPDAGMSARIVFAGDEFNGGMSGDMGEATIWGKKRPAG